MTAQKKSVSGPRIFENRKNPGRGPIWTWKIAEIAFLKVKNHKNATLELKLTIFSPDLAYPAQIRPKKS